MTNLDPKIIAAAQAAQDTWGVPASVSLAQYALESGWGAHMPGNNPFGIKAMPGYAVQTFDTHEVIHGHTIACEARFARFATITQAFDCHAKLLATSKTYTDAFAALPDHTKFVDLMSAHYATDPAYSRKLMAIIVGSKLGQYD